MSISHAQRTGPVHTPAEEAAVAPASATEVDAEAIEREFQEARSAIHRATAARLGTDEDGVYDTIAGARAEVRERIAADAEIMGWIQSDMNGRERERVSALLGVELSSEERRFQESLGAVDGFPAAARAVGNFLESLAPNEGDLFRGQIGISVRISVLTLELTFSVNGSRSPEGFQTQVGLGIFLGFVADTWLCNVRAGATANFSAQGRGDSGAESIELMGLGIQQGIADWLGQESADAVFGEGFADDIIANMDARAPHPGPPPGEGATQAELDAYAAALSAFQEADTVTLTAAGGAELSAESDAAGVGLGLQGGVETAAEYGVDDGGLQRQDTTNAVFETSFTVGGFTVTMGGKGSVGDGPRTGEFEIKFAGESPVAVDHSVLLTSLTETAGAVVQRANAVVGALENEEHVLGARSAIQGLQGANYAAAPEALRPNTSGTIGVEVAVKVMRENGANLATTVELTVTQGLRTSEIALGVGEASVSFTTGTRIQLL